MRSRIGNFVWMAAVISLFVGTEAARAQLPFSFQFKVGQPLIYRAIHETNVSVEQDGKTTATSSAVSQLKRWDVKEVDSLGVATLELYIQELKLEQTDPDGETIKFDSTDITNSHPMLAEQLKPVVGRAIVEVQVDRTGNLKAYKHLTQREDPLRDLPFLVTVPADKHPAVGASWRRDFPIKLDPPIGKGETLRAVQSCVVTETKPEKIVLSTEATLLDELKDPSQMVPIVQFLRKGTVVLDPKKGQMVDADLKVDRTVKDFNGEGTSYKFTSTYRETLQGEVPQQADVRK